MANQHRKRRDRIVLAGLAVLCLLLPLLPLLSDSPVGAPVWGKSVLVAVSFVLVAVSEWNRPRPGISPWPRWLSPAFPWGVLILLAVLLLFRSADPGSAAGGILFALAVLLLYRLLDRHLESRSAESIVTACYLAPLAVVAVIRLYGEIAGDGTGAPAPAWILLAVPLALRGVFRSRSVIVAGCHAVAAAVLAVLLALRPVPYGLAVVALAAVAAGIVATRRRAGSGPGDPDLSDRRIRTALLVGVVVLAALAMVLFNAVTLEIAFTDHLPFDTLYHWELTAAIIQTHPLGVGPGNLPEALATRLVPPEQGDNPLTRWPLPLASDLLRLQAEIGWLFLPLLIWGLAPLWAYGLGAIRDEPDRRDRLAAAGAWMAVLTGSATIFLLEPFASPVTVAGMCLTAALITAAARRKKVPGASPPPVRASRPDRIRNAVTVVAAIVVIVACLRTILAEVPYRRGVEAFHRSEMEAARRAAAASLGYRSGDPRSRLLLAEAKYGGGDWAGAAREFRDLLRLQPNNARLSLRLLDCYRRQGFAREATRLSEELAATWPNSKSIKTESARWLARDGRTEEAERLFMEILEADPQYWPAKLYLGELLESQGRHDQAVFFYRGVARDRPDDPDIFLRLGNNRYRAGRYDRAAVYYTRALELQPDDPEVLIRAGAAYFMIDRYCDAQELMERAIEHGLDPERLRAVNASLEEIRPRCASDRGDPAAGEPETEAEPDS